MSIRPCADKTSVRTNTPEEASIKHGVVIALVLVAKVGIRNRRQDCIRRGDKLRQIFLRQILMQPDILRLQSYTDDFSSIIVAKVCMLTGSFFLVIKHTSY
jgi:hypothetical protein